MENRGHLSRRSLEFSALRRSNHFLIGRGIRTFFHSSTAVSAAVTLVEFGVIATSPEQPKLGFSIETLRFYQQLRRVSPRFSLDAFAKALNHYHYVR